MPTLYFSKRLRPSLTLRIARTLLACVALAGLTAPLAATAAAPGDDDDDHESKWGLGLGALSEQAPYAGMDRENKALPLIYYENRWFHVLGPTAELKLPRLGISDSQHIDFRLVVKYDGSGYEPGDAPILNGMAERKGGAWAGAKVAWHSPFATVEHEWMADVSGNSKGQRFGVSVQKSWRLGQQVMIAPRLGATWLDKQYVDYYFGVRANEATASRVAYSPKATVNTELAVRGTYLMDPHHSFFVDVGATRLGQSIKDSPLVDRSTENRVVLGYLYRF